MNLEARAKEHIKDLRRHIKATILSDVGKVSDTLSNASLSCPHGIAALYRGPRRNHSVYVLYEGEEAETFCRGEPLRKRCFCRSYDAQRAVFTCWRLRRAFTV
jgi:hypothetical protein